jgi:hypothetical protein
MLFHNGNASFLQGQFFRTIPDDPWSYLISLEFSSILNEVLTLRDPNPKATPHHLPVRPDQSRGSVPAAIGAGALRPRVSSS